MKTLSDYPYLRNAFQVIYDDQPYPPHLRIRLMPEAEVPRRWQARFQIANATMSRMGSSLSSLGVTVADLKAEGCYPDIKLGERAFEHVCVPCNDIQRRIYKRAGIARGPADITDKVLYEFFDGELREMFQTAPAPIKIVAVLEVQWGVKGQKVDRWFRINPYNHSGKRLMDILARHEFLVTNACPELVYSAKQKGTPSKSWLAQNLKSLRPDLLLLCGKAAQSTFEASMAPNAKVIKMAHPAARTWTKTAIEKTRRQVWAIINSH